MAHGPTRGRGHYSMKIVHGHRHPGIYEEVWVRFLTDKQVKRGIRYLLKTSTTTDRTRNPRLDVLLTEAEQRESMKAWLTRCLELLDANAAAIEASTITPLSQHDRADS